MKINYLEVKCTNPKCQSSNTVGFIEPMKKDDVEIDLKEDLTDEFAFEYFTMHDVTFFVRCSECGSFSKHVIKEEEIAPCFVPGQKVEELPSISLAFDSYTKLPKTFYLQNHPQFHLKVIACEKISIKLSGLFNFSRQYPLFYESYGLPFGVFHLIVELPDFLGLGKKFFKCVIDVSALPILNYNKIEESILNLRYNCSIPVFNIESVDLTGYQSLIKINKMLGTNDTSQKANEIINNLLKWKQDGEDELSIDYKLNKMLFPKLDKEEDVVEDDGWGMWRSTAAYTLLYFIENKIREFLWIKLAEYYMEKIKLTTNWWKSCFPKEVIIEIEKRHKLFSNMRPGLKTYFPLHFANFTDLQKIFEKEWDSIFKEKMPDKRILFGHLAYLEYLRNSVAHNRPLAKEEIDELHKHVNAICVFLNLELPKVTHTQNSI